MAGRRKAKIERRTQGVPAAQGCRAQISGKAATSDLRQPIVAIEISEIGAVYTALSALRSRPPSILGRLSDLQSLLAARCGSSRRLGRRPLANQDGCSQSALYTLQPKELQTDVMQHTTPVSSSAWLPSDTRAVTLPARRLQLVCAG